MWDWDLPCAPILADIVVDGRPIKAVAQLPWCINTGKSLIPLTLRFLAQKRNLLIPLELSRVMHQGNAELENALLWLPARCSILMPVRRVTAPHHDGDGRTGQPAL